MKGKIGFKHAINGLISVFKSEWNFRFHLFAGLVVIVLSFLLKLTLMEWALVILVIGMVLISELVNTVIEKLIDYLKPDIHPTAKYIKDAAAGAVLVSAICAAVLGSIIFLPKLYELIYYVFLNA